MVNPKSKRMQKAKAKRSHTKKQKLDAKMVAIALIFVMLIVSYVVIFTSQEPQRHSKNMIFSVEDEELGWYSGNVQNLDDVELSDVNLTIRDSSSDSTNSTDVLEHGLVLETEGNFNCTFYDTNHNDMLDDEDEFVVFHASEGDKIELISTSSGEELAFYIFKPPF